MNASFVNTLCQNIYIRGMDCGLWIVNGNTKSMREAINKRKDG